MTQNELRKLFPNASGSFLDLNSGGSNNIRVPNQQKKREVHPTDERVAKLECNPGDAPLEKTKAKKIHTGRYFIRLSSVRKRLCDEVNLMEKYAVDSLRYNNIIPDDNPERVRIETLQRKPEKDEEEKTIIQIFKLNQPDENP